LRARRYGEDIILEEYLEGANHRLIFINGFLAAAIRRQPARVTGDGKSCIRRLIQLQNAENHRADTGCIIPMDHETRRTLSSDGLTFNSVPREGQIIKVRRAANYHAGGIAEDITDSVDADLVRAGQKAASLFGLAVLGVDFIASEKTNRYWIIETDPDAVMSAPENARVLGCFLDYLFPEKKKPGRKKENRRQKHA
jgi:D-alanine-D-alanine ligase-like ATP-grasp enzyme